MSGATSKSLAAPTDDVAAICELGATLDAGTAWHATWKQQIVDEPTWQRLTLSPPQSLAGH